MKTAKKKRLSKNDWLLGTLYFVAKNGPEFLKIDNICKALGVTKGSFYSHFKNREEFLREVVLFWASEYTESIQNIVNKLKYEPPKDRLLSVVKAITLLHAHSFDLSIRALALHEVIVKEGVEKVDKMRLDYLTEIFFEIGFRGKELEMRVRLFVVYFSFFDLVKNFGNSGDLDRIAEMIVELLSHRD
ncbi:MAG: TetR/AcrR family transcriptional regulator [Rhizobiaceae bacterium]